MRCHLTLGAICALLVGGVMIGASPAPAQAQQLSVLFCGTYSPRAWEFESYRRELARYGIESTSMQQFGSGYSQPTLEYMKQFEVVAVVGEPEYDTASDRVPPQFLDFVDRLEEYRRAGGGLLLMPCGSSYSTDFREKCANAMLQRWAVQLLGEQIVDPEHTYHSLPPLFPFDYFWTTNMAPHPVTKGVQRLFLPVYGDHQGAATLPMRYGEGWQVLVRGMPSAHTIPADPEALAGRRGHGGMAYLPDQVGTVASAPAIIVQQTNTECG